MANLDFGVTAVSSSMQDAPEVIRRAHESKTRLFLGKMARTTRDFLIDAADRAWELMKTGNAEARSAIAAGLVSACVICSSVPAHAFDRNEEMGVTSEELHDILQHDYFMDAFSSYLAKLEDRIPIERQIEIINSASARDGLTQFEALISDMHGEALKYLTAENVSAFTTAYLDTHPFQKTMLAENDDEKTARIAQKTQKRIPGMH